MKPNRDALALAASLTNAAKTPLPLPQPAQEPIVPDQAAKSDPGPAKKSAKAKAADTVQITLRPDRGLLDDYTFEAAERTKIERRVVSAQEIMIEVLERGRPRAS
ncbi:MAG TPA: hypothetical protein VE986_03295 [Hyphomicrobiales bacterium]|nr:hypothetical protein [Hyphomicrobiales bacterium]